MKDTLSFVLVLLIATTSLNRGEEIEDFKTKEFSSKRRAGIFTPSGSGRLAGLGSGMFIGPRPGRSPGMTGFTRIDRAAGLMTFPRVGRSDSTDYDVVLDFNPEDMSEIKRQGLIPYPRVGRSHEVAPSLYGNEIVKVAKVKRTGDAGSNGGMWFGPRLGRLHRRGDEQQTDDQQWAIFPFREFSSATGQQSENFTPRLAHESDQVEDGQSILNNGVY